MSCLPNFFSDLLFQQLSLLLIEIFVHRAFLVTSSTHSAHLNLLYLSMCDKLVVSTIEKLDSATVSSQQTITILYCLFIGVVKNAKGGSATLIFTTYSGHQI